MNTNLSEKTQPWYRHSWPWILMAGPFIVVIAGLFTAYLAVKSNDGLVDGDYYKQGLAINKMNEREQKALSLGLQATLMQSADGAQIRALLHAGPGVVLPEVLKLHIVHPTRAGVDQNLLLRADGGGAYSGKLGALLVGRWHIALEDEKNEWRLTGNWTIEQDASLQLPVIAQAVK
ncbi:FixH family protein [Propionivibrio sp.]|uniref:FixH family protein n=1 Tax=Propionivibrio sp. TaxID=2212460 RepID=UPI00261F9F10|nr:FixH family protein [Propionivibrio sp.]